MVEMNEDTSRGGFFLGGGMPIELTPERKMELIDKIAEEIVKHEMETLALMFLEVFKPVSRMATQITMPFFSPFMGILSFEQENVGNDLIALFMERENIELILRKVEDLSERKREQKKKVKEMSQQPKKSMWERLKKRLSPKS